jgi:hypothetical protein
MTAQELILAGLGILLSIGFTYIPFIATWYYGIDSKFRGLVMLGFSVVVVGVIFGLSCTGMFNWVACSKAGIEDLGKGLLILLGTNQITYNMTPDSKFKTA